MPKYSIGRGSYIVAVMVTGLPAVTLVGTTVMVSECNA